MAEVKTDFLSESEEKISDIAMKTEQRLSRIIDSSPVAIAFVRVMDNKIIQINDSYLEMLGYSREEVLGKTAKELNMWVDYRQRISLIQQMELKNFVRNREVTFRKKDGRNIPIVLSIEKIEFKDEAPLFVFFALDISTQAKYSAELKKSLDKEKESIILKNRLISMISHEYRTPLTAIVLSTEILKDYGESLKEENRNQQFERIEKSIKGMNNLLEDIIDYSKLDVGKVKFAPSFIDIGSLCMEIKHDMEYYSSNKCDIELNVNTRNMLISLDEKLIRKIMNKLLSNAVKFSKSGSKVIFNVDLLENAIEFNIIDEGHGIPEEDQDKIFDPFHRSTKVETTPGTGLGLAIVKNSVEIHGGSISFVSSEDKGSTFTVRIPLSESAVFDRTMIND